MISAILLAAGLSTRMGSLKQLLPFGQKTIVEACVSNLRDAGITQITVVTGYQADRVERVLQPLGVKCVRNRDYAQGMTSSVKAGILSLDSQCEATLLALSDQPHIPPALISKLLEYYFSSNRMIVKPRYQGQSGHPIILNYRIFAEILNLNQDEGLHTLTRRYTQQTGYLETLEKAVVEDLDTEHDYLELLKRLNLWQT